MTSGAQTTTRPMPFPDLLQVMERGMFFRLLRALTRRSQGKPGDQTTLTDSTAVPLTWENATLHTSCSCEKTQMPRRMLAVALDQHSCCAQFDLPDRSQGCGRHQLEVNQGVFESAATDGGANCQLRIVERFSRPSFSEHKAGHAGRLLCLKPVKSPQQFIARR